MPPPPRQRVSRLVLAEVFARSFLLQAGFNPKAMQSLGFTYALYPALRSLHPKGETRAAAVNRHLSHFNTHPYFAAALLGGSVRIEEEIAAGRADPSRVEGFRAALASPLAAIGDAFFWNALRPACALIAILTAPFLGLWSVLLFLALYNGVHLSVRGWLFVVGYREAENLVKFVGEAQFPVGTKLLRRVAAALAGAVAALFAAFAGTNGGPVLFAAVGGAIVASVVLLERVPPWVLAYAALALGILGGLVFPVV